MKAPRQATGAGGSNILPRRRFVRGRWKRINYSAEAADHAMLRAAEAALTTVNEYARRLDEHKAKAQAYRAA